VNRNRRDSRPLIAILLISPTASSSLPRLGVPSQHL